MPEQENTLTGSLINGQDLLQALEELCIVVFHAGLFDQLSPHVKGIIASNENLAYAIASKGKPSLEPRLTLNEYREYILKFLRVPTTQTDFYRTIVDICYMMFLVEKNPLVAQELKGATTLSHTLEEIMKR